MGLFIGMDEAGYGPNLGPLVVTVTAWEVPDQPCDTDFYAAMDDVITAAPSAGSSRLHVADSKQVYSSSRGIANLERSVLCALNLCGLNPFGFQELWRLLSPSDIDSGSCARVSQSFKMARGGWGRSGVLGAQPPVLQSLGAPCGRPQPPLSEQRICSDSGEPWLDECDFPIPVAEHAVGFGEIVGRWQDCCRRQGIRLRAIRSDVVPTRRFNRLNRENGSKGVTLSRISLRLLRSVWDPDDPQPTFIVADKHGGRNRYGDLLAEVLDDRMIFRGTESTPHSDYRIGNTSIRFQTKAESHFPVALASMVCKYVRELAMLLFNQFWRTHLPDLKPTKGYPVDAKRFRAEIAALQKQLGIDDDVLWRER